MFEALQKRKLHKHPSPPKKEKKKIIIVIHYKAIRDGNVVWNDTIQYEHNRCYMYVYMYTNVRLNLKETCL